MFALRPLALGLLCLGALSACGGTTQSLAPLAPVVPAPTASPTPSGSTATTLAVPAGASTATLPR